MALNDETKLVLWIGIATITIMFVICMIDNIFFSPKVFTFKTY